VKRLAKFAALETFSMGLLLVVGISLTTGRRLFIGPQSRSLTGRTFERTPEHLAWGAYLVESRMERASASSLHPSCPACPLPNTQIVFPVRYLIRSVPQPVIVPVVSRDPSDPVKRGPYLVNAAACTDCHTPHPKGQPLSRLNLAGGFTLQGPWAR